LKTNNNKTIRLPVFTNNKMGVCKGISSCCGTERHKEAATISKTSCVCDSV
jgi:hypothetical protein